MISCKRLYFYPRIHSLLFKQTPPQKIFITLLYAKNIARFALGISCFIFILALEGYQVSWTGLPFILLALVLVYIFFSDFIPRLFTVPKSEKLFKIGAFFVSLYQLLCLPLIFIYLKIYDYFDSRFEESKVHHGYMREKVYDLIEETWPEHSIENRDRKLIESILKFKKRIVREVMVPRSDIFAIEASTPIKDVAGLLFDENYSRIPVYRETLDNVVGLLFYKDFLSLYLELPKLKDPDSLNQPVEVLMKKPLYTAETARIANLLQEFLHKQQHLALVVDEFGALEGLVTIEDVLEEIVGEIEDEYDEEDFKKITQQKDSWIVDGKLSLHELESITELKIPHQGDYDSIGGYIMHRAGQIPEKGLKISHDEFELEVIQATERHVEKVKITPSKHRADY